MQDIAWFIVNLDDVRSDFSVYHRVDEIEALPAERFLAYTRRLHLYGGAVALLVRQAAENGAGAQPDAQDQESAWTDITDLMRTDPLFMGQGTYVAVPAE